MTIAAGTTIAGRPLHGSVREELPHTALAASRSRNRTLGYGWPPRSLRSPTTLRHRCQSAHEKEDFGAQ